jgi:hypothetical protein
VFGAGGSNGFSRWAYRKDEFDRRLGTAVAPWYLHDLRRTCATVMGEDLGVLPHVVEACLNHLDHKQGVRGTYNLALYARETRDAWVRWAVHVLDLAAGRSPTVVPIKIA